MRGRGRFAPKKAGAKPDARPDADITIVLSHSPDEFPRISSWGTVDLVLAGHNHGGQIRLPFIGPLILPPLGKRYPEGLYRFGHVQLYVNRGIGTVGLPLRWNCPAEITHITLVRA